jgi:hypothetical protein
MPGRTSLLVPITGARWTAPRPIGPHEGIRPVPASR